MKTASWATSGMLQRTAAAPGADGQPQRCREDVRVDEDGPAYSSSASAAANALRSLSVRSGMSSWSQDSRTGTPSISSSSVRGVRYRVIRLINRVWLRSGIGHRLFSLRLGRCHKTRLPKGSPRTDDAAALRMLTTLSAGPSLCHRRESLDDEKQKREDDSDEGHRARADGDEHLNRTICGDVGRHVNLRREEGEPDGSDDAKQLDGSCRRRRLRRRTRASSRRRS